MGETIKFAWTESAGESDCAPHHFPNPCQIRAYRCQIGFRGFVTETGCSACLTPSETIKCRSIVPPLQDLNNAPQ